MNAFTRWRRSAAALTAAAAAVVPLATLPAIAEAAPARTATTTKYTRATYLQHALGLPAANTDPVIESVTYDRFQHLLQQSGDFAILIGDPATDATFAARAQDVEVVAKAAGAKKVYWFNPNLSGNAKLGATTAPTLDIRNPAGINLSARSQEIYGKAWLNLVGQYLGNGVTATQNEAGTQSATVTIAPGTDTVNDYGTTAGFSTEVGNTSGGALYDYKTATPADASDSFFLIYNKTRTVTAENRPSRIVSWINLSEETASAATRAKVTTAINTVGAGSLGRVDQFDWWKSEANLRQNKQAPGTVQGGNVPVVTDADNAAAEGGWRVNQISYPELVDLLKNATDAEAVILFGGTWCPNTRAVLPFVNRHAQANDVTVYNFDTVLDGGIVGGGTTSGANPLQSRNNAAYQTATNANPSYLFGDAQAQFLHNLVTEYTPTGTGANPVQYYPGGDTTKPLATARRLQVPYLVGYQGKAGDQPNGGVTRQWIHKKPDGTYKEYMSQWYLTNPQPNQLGLGQIPQNAAIWSTINAQLANFTWKTDPTTVAPNTTVFSDAGQYLAPDDKATVTFTPASGSNPATVAATSGGANPIAIDPAALSAAQAALGAAAPANLTGARAAVIAAHTATTPDPALIANLSTVFGAFQIVSPRKNALLSAWGTVDGASGVTGGLRARRAAEVFFGSLPGGLMTTTRTVTATPVASDTAATISLSIASAEGRKATGNIALNVTQNGTSVATASSAAVDNAVAFTLPVLAAGTYEYTLSYAGDDQILAFTETGSLTISPAEVPPVETPVATPVATPVVVPGPPATTPTVTRTKASKLAGAVSKTPTSRKAGRYKVTITTPKTGAKATGKVTLKLKKGKTTKTVTGTLKGGTVTVAVPKLARGTWKVTISWPGDSKYLAGSAAGASIKVTR